MVAVAGTSSDRDSFTAVECTTVVYWQSLPPLTLTPDEARGYFIRGTAIAGVDYRLERAPFVAGPWTVHARTTATAAGLLQFHDSNPLPGQAFYRLAQE